LLTSAGIAAELLSLLHAVAVSDNMKTARMLSAANPSVHVAKVQDNP
jgi:hypothetical protein